MLFVVDLQEKCDKNSRPIKNVSFYSEHPVKKNFSS